MRRNPLYLAQENTVTWAAEPGARAYQVVIRKLQSGIRVWGPYYVYATTSLDLKKIIAHVPRGESYTFSVAAPSQNLETIEIRVPLVKISSTGDIFTEDFSNPALGEAWRDPSGVVWGDVVMDGVYWQSREPRPRDFDFAEANEYCAAIGARLPGMLELNRLASYFGTNPRFWLPQDSYRPQVLPNLDKDIWTSNSLGSQSLPYYINQVSVFDGRHGGYWRAAYYENWIHVRCIDN